MPRSASKVAAASATAELLELELAELVELAALVELSLDAEALDVELAELSVDAVEVELELLAAALACSAFSRAWRSLLSLLTMSDCGCGGGPSLAASPVVALAELAEAAEVELMLEVLPAAWPAAAIRSRSIRHGLAPEESMEPTDIV